MKQSVESQVIKQLIKSRLAVALNTNIQNIDEKKQFSQYGLSSIKAVGLSAELADELHMEISPSVFFDYENVGLLADYIAEAKKNGSKGKIVKAMQAKKPKNKKTAKLNIKSHNIIPEIEAVENLLEKMRDGADASLFFTVNEEIQKQCEAKGIPFINFSQYDYLGLSNHPEVKRAAIAAIEKYGNSASASRLVGGELNLHQQLENEISTFLGTEACIVFNSGHGTNVSTIGSVMTENDLIIMDEYSHNSIVLGAKLSKARTLMFKHNDAKHLRKILLKEHEKADRIMIIIEGLYSMDGDIPDLPAFIKIKKEFKTLLYIDEAHSLGLIGKTGRGIMEYYNVDPNDVDFSMGTIGKALGTMGGYVAGKKSLIKFLKHTVPSFVYSVGLTPACVSGALKALKLLRAHPELVTELNAKTNYLLTLLRENGINCGEACGAPIIPIITGNSRLACKLSLALRAEGVIAPFIIYPAVPDKSARLRLFISNQYTKSDLKQAAEKIITLMKKLRTVNDAEFPKSKKTGS